MTMKLPGWPLLQTVEAVVRLGSFKLAAEEQFLTPSAVSHRIKQLEEDLRHPLFERVGQGILPTQDAMRIATVVANAQREVGDVWKSIKDDAATRPVRVQCMAGFGDHFLLSGIQDFKRKFPDFELELTSNVTGLPKGGRHADIMIGLGKYPEGDWLCEDLLEFQVQPIAAPDAVSRFFRDGRLTGPLLGYAGFPQLWHDVAAAIDVELQPDARIIGFDSAQSLCAAARSGVGIALAPSWLAREWIDAGHVVALGAGPVSVGGQYWVAVRRTQERFHNFDHFHRWLKSRIAQRSGMSAVGA